MRKYAEQRLQEEKEMRELVQQVAEGHRNSKMAKEKLHKFKQDIGNLGPAFTYKWVFVAFVNVVSFKIGQ